MNRIEADKNLDIVHNVYFRIYDTITGKFVKEYKGHNQATNLMLEGIACFLRGDGVLDQGIHTLSDYIPQYISLGTMGLTSQETDNNGLPSGLEENYQDHRPSYGADGYDENDNNDRKYLGIGPAFDNRTDKSKTIDCELISASFPRAPITYRQIIPEYKAEYPHSVDLVLSAMVSTGALAQFREKSKDYIFITEAGLWSKQKSDTGSQNASNGLLAGYRILPPDKTDWTDKEKLKKHIIRVNKNQVVQIIWKICLGSRESFTDKSPVVCDCTCKDRIHPDANCPCHGGKATAKE